jgi:hypothetical protein
LNLGENLGNSFDYAKKLFTDAGRLIILIILDIIPIVNLIVSGYAARVVRETPGVDAPPKLEKYGELFVDGLKILVAALVYMIIPLALIFAGVGSFFASMFMFQGEAAGPGMVLGGTGVALLLIGVVLAFFILLIAGIGIAHMIKTGKFGKAFAFGEILGIIRKIGWGKYIGWAVVTFIIAAVVGGVAGAIPFIGWLISAIIGPALTVFVFRSLGLMYHEGAPAEFTGPTMPPAGGVPAAGGGEKFCINCGAKLPANAGFCGACGAKQT